MALELVRHPVTVLTTTGAEPSAFAAKVATSTIPIVFTTGDDPVRQGPARGKCHWGQAFNRPSGAEAPRPVARVDAAGDDAIGVLLNPARSGSASQLSDVQEAVRTLNLQVHILRASTDREIESAFETVAPQGIQALSFRGLARGRKKERSGLGVCVRWIDRQRCNHHRRMVGCMRPELDEFVQ